MNDTSPSPALTFPTGVIVLALLVSVWLSAVLTLGCTSLALADANQNEDKEIYKFAVTDIVGLEELQREFTAFQDTLEHYTGHRFQLFPVTGRTIVVESFRNRRLDFALIGPAEYVAVHSRTEVIPLVGLQRENYRAALITRANSGLNSIQDLAGKKIAFGDFGSTSYHLAPLQLLAENGMNDTSRVQMVNVNKYVSWKSLLRSQVDAIGFNYNRFEQFIAEDPKLRREDFQILAVTPILPSDLFVAAPHVPAAVQEKVRLAFQEHGESLLNAMLQGKRNAKYLNMSFKTNITNDDYEYIRQMYKTAGLETLAGHS
jgi:phosphonate transport system substrate-binding protein